MESFSIKTKSKEEFIDITAEIDMVVKAKNIISGLCTIYIPHTTAGITINENADRDVPRDILKGFSNLDFENMNFLHQEGNSPAHIKSSIIGCTALIIIHKGILQLGTWQGIFFCEFDGPRKRDVYIKIQSD